MCWDVSNLHRWAMSQKMLSDSFKYRKDKFRFDEVFVQNYDEGKNKE